MLAISRRKQFGSPDICPLLADAPNVPEIDVRAAGSRTHVCAPAGTRIRERGNQTLISDHTGGTSFGAYAPQAYERLNRWI